MEKTPKNAEKFYCENCEFRCSKQSDWDRHIARPRHTNKLNNIVKSAIHMCLKCEKIYKYNSGLWNHAKTCIAVKDTPENIIIKDTPEADKTLIKLLMELMRENKEIMKDNQEFRQAMIEMAAKNSTTNNNNNNINTTNNNSNNKTFNLQLFLNEQCKDAMNMSEFIDSFKLQLADLESVGELGYVDGMSTLFLNKLKDLDIYKRPVHCSDVKRETMYVKEQDKWAKEEKSNPKIRDAVQKVSHKNMVMIPAWRNAHPDCSSSKSELNSYYTNIIRQAYGGTVEIEGNEDKIIRRIAKEVAIEKTA